MFSMDFTVLPAHPAFIRQRNEPYMRVRYGLALIATRQLRYIIIIYTLLRFAHRGSTNPEKHFSEQLTTKYDRH